jgi:hydroxymethylpyrimidine/phosphomethylpyrimidine kinase
MVGTVLSIAGLDPSGGAGVAADLKTMAAFRCQGSAALTAITVQNGKGVQAVEPVARELLAAQVRVVAAGTEVRAVKIGMLGNAELVLEVAALIDQLRLPNVVLDPVLRSSSGFDLLDQEGRELLRKELLQRAEVVTPNLAEAASLTRRSVGDVAEMKEAARELHGMGARQVVVKGGHLPDRAVDVLFDGEDFAVFDSSRVVTGDAHGLGCTFSSALACGLARGFPLVQAIEDGKRYVAAALGAGLRGSHGETLLDHGAVWDGGRGPG